MTRCPLLPVADFVVIKADAPSTRSGHIILLDAAPPSRGRVVRVGPDAVGLRPRDYVAFEKFRSTVVTVDGNAWALLRARDIVCRLA